MLRRVAIAVAIVVYSEVQVFQLLIFYAFSFATVGVLYGLNPLTNIRERRYELINEATHLALLAIIPVFAEDFVVSIDDTKDDSGLRKSSTFIVLSLLMGHLGLNLIVILPAVLQTNITRVVRYRYNRRVAR